MEITSQSASTVCNLCSGLVDTVPSMRQGYILPSVFRTRRRSAFPARLESTIVKCLAPQGGIGTLLSSRVAGKLRAPQISPNGVRTLPLSAAFD